MLNTVSIVQASTVLLTELIFYIHIQLKCQKMITVVICLVGLVIKQNSFQAVKINGE